MIPMVQTEAKGGEAGKQDARKTREVFWKEAKLSLVRRFDESQPLFAVTLGGPAEAGADRVRLARAAGFESGSRVHGLGDGAPWITAQMEQQFGRQGSYLVDFCHVCDYLDAAKECASNDPDECNRKCWMGKEAAQHG